MVLICIEEFNLEVDNGEYIESETIPEGTILQIEQLEIVNTIVLEELDLTIYLSFDELFRYFKIILM